MYREPEYRTEYVDTTDAEGNTWRICYTYTETCIQSGNFSSVAADPDEYFGIYSYEYQWVNWAEVSDSADGEYYELIEENFPDWMIDEAMDEVENMG